MLLDAEVADLLAICGKDQIQPGSHPVVRIPEDQASVTFRREATNYNAIIVQVTTVWLEVLKEVECIGHGCNLEYLDRPITWKGARYRVPEVVNRLLHHKCLPSPTVF